MEVRKSDRVIKKRFLNEVKLNLEKKFPNEKFFIRWNDLYKKTFLGKLLVCDINFKYDMWKLEDYEDDYRLVRIYIEKYNSYIKKISTKYHVTDYIEDFNGF